MQFVYTKILYIHVSKHDLIKNLSYTQPTHTNLLHTRNYKENSKPLLRVVFFCLNMDYSFLPALEIASIGIITAPTIVTGSPIMVTKESFTVLAVFKTG